MESCGIPWNPMESYVTLHCPMYITYIGCCFVKYGQIMPTPGARILEVWLSTIISDNIR